MNVKKVIEDIQTAIKTNLDLGYNEDMLIPFELDVIHWNVLLEYITCLEQENRKLKRKLEKANESCEMFRRFLYYADLAYKESQQKINGDVEDE